MLISGVVELTFVISFFVSLLQVLPHVGGDRKFQKWDNGHLELSKSRL